MNFFPIFEHLRNSIVFLDFQLFAIEQGENGEQFNETYDFRIPSRHPRAVAQPTDIGWSPTEGSYSNAND